MVKRLLYAALVVLLLVTGQIASAQRPRPSPPPEIRLKASGVLLLDLDDATGKVVRVRILESTGYRILDEASKKAFSEKRFKPHTRSPLTMPIRFSVRPDAR